MKKTILFTISLLASLTFFGQCNDLFISEYVHAYGNDRALEIYNPTKQNIDLSKYQLVRYSNGGTTPAAVALSSYLAPFECWVVVSDKRDPNGTGLDTMVSIELQNKADTFLCPVYSQNKMMYFNGNDAVTLERLDGTYIDIIGKIGENPAQQDPNGSSGGWTADTTNGFTDAGGARWWTRRNTLIRKFDISNGVASNPVFFNPVAEWDSVGVKTFDSLGFHKSVCLSQEIKQISKTNNCFFYPNPSSAGFFLVKGTEIIKKVEILNIVGQIIFSEENQVRRGDMRITTTDFEKGMYVVKVYFADNTCVTKKIVLK